MTSSYTEIDYLSEDKEIVGQKYALISVVGPNLAQKCNVYGIKIRGVAETLEQSKLMSKKIHNIDPDFDIFTVEVGKFVPLDVDPLQLKDVEYNNSQLNELIKGYLENRENATEEYEKRKYEMRKQAIADGRSNNKNEEHHPISILNRIDELTNKMKEVKQKFEEYSNSLSINQTEFDKFTEDVKNKAKEEYNKLKLEAESNADNTIIKKLSEKSLTEIPDNSNKIF